MHNSKFLAPLVFIKLSVCVFLILLTLLFFHYLPSFEPEYTEFLNLCSWVLKFIWAVTLVWLIYPLLAFWPGRLLVIFGAVFLTFMLLPLFINIQVMAFVESVLKPTFLPHSWVTAGNLLSAGHFFGFLFLSIAAFSLYFSRFVNVFILLLGSALLSELLQQFSAGRSSSIEDFVIDVVGISLAGFFVYFIRRTRVILS